MHACKILKRSFQGSSLSLVSAACMYDLGAKLHIVVYNIITAAGMKWLAGRVDRK